MKTSTDERFQTLNNKWQSVLHTGLMWPGEYQNAVDTCGNPHNPWGVDLTYFECCTGTPCVDDQRVSAFASTDISPINIARKMGKSVEFQGMTLRVQEIGGDDVHVTEGGSILFSIHRQDDSGVGGTVCIFTAFSPRAGMALIYYQAAEFRLGAFSIFPHGRYERTIQTQLGPKRLVHIVGINEGDTDSSKLAAIFTIEDDSAIAYQPCPANDHFTLADHVIARGVLAFHNGGLTFCIGPTIESIVARRDYHGHGLARCLFGAIEEWFRHNWQLDTKKDGRTLQATQLTHAIVDGVVLPGNKGGGGGDETGACRGLAAVTEIQLFEASGFNITRSRKGSYDAMMSGIHPKHYEGAKLWLPTKNRSQYLTDIALGWRSCDYCFDLEGDTDKLKVCTGCVCERYFAGRYCSTICQKKDRPRHKLSCGKTRGEVNVDYLLFRLGGR